MHDHWKIMRDGNSSSDAGDYGRRGNELFRRYEESQDRSALDEAIRSYVLATQVDSGQTVWWRNLAVALLRRHAATKSLDDCAQAISALTEAAKSAGVDRASRTGLARLLGLAWQASFEATGAMSSLDNSIRAYRDALDPDSPDPTILWHLSSAVWHRFEVSGRPADLDSAVVVYQEALAQVPENSPGFAELSENAGIAFRMRFEHGGRPEDLAEAISLARHSCRVTVRTDPRLPIRLSNLAGSLKYRWDLVPEADVLDEAISSCYEALELLPRQHSERAHILSNLAGMLQTRAWKSEDQADLDWAIDLFREAVGLQDGKSVLISLASALADRYKVTQEIADLDEAVAVGRRSLNNRDPEELSILAHVLMLRVFRMNDMTDLAEAVGLFRECLALRSSDSHSYAGTLLDLGHALEMLGDTDAEAIELFRRAAHTLHAPIHVRIMGALSWSRISSEIADWAAAADAAELAVDLLPHAAHEDLSRVDQEYGLDRWGGLAAHAAACALQLGDARRALRLLEAGHGILLARVLDENDEDDGPEEPLDGPVVLVNTTHLRSDALIVTPDSVSSIPLPAFTNIAHRVARFVDATEAATRAPDPRERKQAQQVIYAELAWLWDRVTGPVLTQLGITGAPEPGQEWPRIWWARSSLLASFPLHAAGHHDERDSPNPRTVMDRVVSSYTPTVRALRRRRKASAASMAGKRLLIVAVPEAPGAPELPGVLHEATSLASTFPSDLILGEQATRVTVLSALRSHPFAHFACHGISDVDNPSASRLLLHDHDINPLTVRHISQQELTDADLAYLSACDSARFSMKLSDEAIHIVTAFQLAGYSHVIGTLWRIDDYVAGEVADEFYRELQWAGFDSNYSAFALHATSRTMRDRYIRFPALWASHIHAGP